MSGCDSNNNTSNTATYLPVGTQQNVSVTTVTSGGWTECYKDTYADEGTSLTDIQNQCSGDRLMLACRATDSDTITLLAQAPREDVLYDTGTDSTTTYESNGVAWYYNPDWSWGFTEAGNEVSKNECDTAGASDDATRLCWHTGVSVPNTMYGGYRCGSAGEQWDIDYERVIYTAN